MNENNTIRIIQYAFSLKILPHCLKLTNHTPVVQFSIQITLENQFINN